VSSGGHVKILPHAALSILPTTWYVVPVCATHNKGLSSKTFEVKEGTIAVDATPVLVERFRSWGKDFQKFGLTVQGKKR
jgi:hypothetical protein